MPLEINGFNGLGTLAQALNKAFPNFGKWQVCAATYKVKLKVFKQRLCSRCCPLHGSHNRM